MSPVTKSRLKLLFSLFRKRRPPLREEHQLKGISNTVTITRDPYGIPRISAETARDLFFGFGYIMAEDRLFQMDLNRRAALGRLSELVGDQPVGSQGVPYPLRRLRLPQIDLFWRALGFGRIAEREVTLLSPEAKGVLEGFTDGVNACIEAMVQEGRLPLECMLLGYRPDPWRSEDSLAVGKLVGWTLSLSLQTDLALGLFADDPVLKRLLPFSPEAGPSILGDGLSRSVRELLDLERTSRNVSGGEGPALGSNSFVVAGRRSATGRPILANDPHLPFALPPFWYQVILDGGGFQVAGGAMPGIPGVLIGMNPFIAWGMTNGMIDDADLYVETLHPKEPGRYRVGDDWRPMKVAVERIRVRGEERPREVSLRSVDHGGVDCPLISDLLTDQQEGQALSLRWTGFEPSQGLDALLEMNRARNLEEFQEALRLFAVPPQNIVYADREGNIAYFLAGWIPRRAKAGDGLVPMDGSSGEHEWQGRLSFEELPKAINPKEGFLATANEKIAPGFEGHLFEPPYRSARIRQLLQEKPKHRLENLAAIQGDLCSLQADLLIQALLAPHLDAFHGEVKEAAERLVRWDRRLKAESQEAALFHAFYDTLLKGLFKEKLNRHAPGLYERYFSIFHVPVTAADTILVQQDRDFFGEEPVRVIERALQEAVEELERSVGRDRSRWQWGVLHPLTLRHPLSRGQDRLSRLLNRLFKLNRGPFPHPGDGMTPNLAAFFLTEPFQAMVGPSYRQLIDLDDPDRSLWIVAGGASGDPRSIHYADQVPLWRKGQYLPMRFLPKEEAMKEGSALLFHPLPSVS